MCRLSFKPFLYKNMSSSTSTSHSSDRQRNYNPRLGKGFTGAARNSNTREHAMTPKKPTDQPPSPPNDPATQKFYSPTQTPPNQSRQDQEIVKTKKEQNILYWRGDTCSCVMYCMSSFYIQCVQCVMMRIQEHNAFTSLPWQHGTYILYKLQLGLHVVIHVYITKSSLGLLILPSSVRDPPGRQQEILVNKPFELNSSF